MPETPEEKATREAAEAAARAAAAAAGTGGAPPPGDKSKEPYASFPDADAFNKRMDREARSRLKALGVEDPDKLKELLDAGRKAEEQRVAAENAAKSELQRAVEAAAAAQAESKRLQEELEAERTQRELMGVFLKEGITNTDYAFFKVSQALDGLKDGEQLDEIEFLRKLKADPVQAAALGIGGQAATVTTTGATTTATGTNPDPKPKDAGGGNNPPPSAFDMTPSKFADGVEAKYGFRPPGM